MTLYVLSLIGVGVFAISGAQVAEAGQLHWLLVTVMGTITGVAGLRLPVFQIPNKDR